MRGCRLEVANPHLRVTPHLHLYGARRCGALLMRTSYCRTFCPDSLNFYALFEGVLALWPVEVTGL